MSSRVYQLQQQEMEKRKEVKCVSEANVSFALTSYLLISCIFSSWEATGNFTLTHQKCNPESLIPYSRSICLSDCLCVCESIFSQISFQGKGKRPANPCDERGMRGGEEKHEGREWWNSADTGEEKKSRVKSGPLGEMWGSKDYMCNSSSRKGRSESLTQE